MAKPKPKDDLLVMGPSLGEGGQRPYVRQNEEGTRVGVLRPVKEGESLTEDALVVEHRGPGPIYKVTPVFDKAKSRPSTESYRQGWEKVFGGGRTVGQA